MCAVSDLDLVPRLGYRRLLINRWAYTKCLWRCVNYHFDKLFSPKPGCEKQCMTNPYKTWP
jgi:hypothetical protein